MSSPPLDPLGATAHDTASQTASTRSSYTNSWIRHDLSATPFASEAWDAPVTPELSGELTVGPSSDTHARLSDSSSSPIHMPRQASSLSRSRSPSTSGFNEGRQGPFQDALYGVSTTPRGKSPFFAGAHRGDDSEEANVEASNSPSRPSALKRLLAEACVEGDLYKLQTLLSSASGQGEGSDAVFRLSNQRLTRGGLTALHLCAGRGHDEMLRWLIESAGAGATVQDNEGETPLHKAAHKGHLGVCRFLTAKNVGLVNVPDSDGWRALHNAAARGWLDIVRLLIDAGADVNARSKHGYTALMNAASKGQLPTLQFLLKRGAVPNMRNEWHETAYDLAAAVFEVHICSKLAQAEGSENPLITHSTYPVVLEENVRLAIPTVKKLSSLSTLATGQPPRWSAKALSRNDRRAPFTMPTVPGRAEVTDLPVSRGQVGLPIVRAESSLVLPSPDPPSQDSGSSSAQSTPHRPSGASRRSSASASLSTLLASTYSSSTLAASPPESSNNAPFVGDPAWYWISDWQVDLTDPSSSATDGWSYASSFDAPRESWTPEPPDELQQIIDGSLHQSLGGRKWIRRRRWVRVMRRRVDIPEWGWGPSPQSPRSPTSLLEHDASHDDYLARAHFLAGVQAYPSAADDVSIRSGKTFAAPDAPRASRRAGLRKAAARLERAVDELRIGMQADDDVETRARAQGDLEGYLHQLAAVQDELGLNEDERASDDDSPSDAQETAQTEGSLASSPGLDTQQSMSGGPDASQEDYFSQGTVRTMPIIPPEISRAPEFRVPTHEVAPLSTPMLPPVESVPLPSQVAAEWEPDEATRDCRRCGTRFSFFLRKHHCRKCGQVVCASCSNHSDRLDPLEIVHEPGYAPEAYSARYRTCDTCHAALVGARQDATSAAITSGAFFTNVSSPNAQSSQASRSSDAGASDVSDLSDCPLCGSRLAMFGSKDAQEEHVRACLETGGGSIVSSGRYLVFKLQAGPLTSEESECSICFESFEVGEKAARLACMCLYHAQCISSWMSRGHGCPFHASRDVI